MVTIYLSSTLKDLLPEREAVKQALSGMAVVKESYDADKSSVRASCLKDVEGCDVYVGLIGLRYGFIPPGKSKSITELEFDQAQNSKKRILLFIKNEASILAVNTDAHTREHDPELIRSFRARLTAGTDDVPRPAMFDDPAGLKEKLLRALLRDVDEALETPVAVQETAVETAQPIAPPPDHAESAMCSMLRVYLHRHGIQTCLADVSGNVSLIEGIAPPLSVDSVMQFATARDDCCRNLVKVASCLRSGKENAGLSERVEGALVRIILVIAETYLRVAAAQEGYQPGREDPIWEREILMASLIAAERMDFGLCFKGGKREPENVLEITPPAFELGNLDEAGPGLIRSEVIRALNRSQVGSGRAISKAYLTESVRQSSQDFNASIVVSTFAEGEYAQPASRVALRDFLGDYEIKTFFRAAEKQAVPPWAAEVIGDLDDALAAAFPPAKKTGDEQMTNQGNSGNSGAAVNIQINAPMSGVLNLGDHAQVAGHDINMGNPADWGKVAQAVQALHDAIAALADGAPQKASLLADVKDVGDAVAAGKPKDGDAKLVKRCLEGLKQGAEAVENGEKIIEKVTPVWDGLKSAWPAFLALIS